MRSLALLALVLPIAAQAAMGSDDARHLLNRAGFGATPHEIAEYARLSRPEAVDRLLAATRKTATTPAPDWVTEPITPPRVLRSASQEERRAFQAQEIRRGFELRNWWLEEMLETPSPLTERMTLFWHNHFVSSQQKVRKSPGSCTARTCCCAGMRSATSASCCTRSPATRRWSSISTTASEPQGQPNENFAREVMELFTLGEGHYTERDIKEAARAFTGWSVEPDDGTFVFRRSSTTTGSKTVLGRTGELRRRRRCSTSCSRSRGPPSSSSRSCGASSSRPSPIRRR